MIVCALRSTSPPAWRSTRTTTRRSLACSPGRHARPSGCWAAGQHRCTSARRPTSRRGCDRCSSTLIREIVARGLRPRRQHGRADRSGRCLLVLDEAPNIAPLPDLDQIASTGAGQGIQLVTVVQDLAQVHARWGAKADTIVNNHRAKLFGPGLSCEKTLDYVSRVLGDRELRQVSRTSGEHGRRSTTESRPSARSRRPTSCARAARARCCSCTGTSRPCGSRCARGFGAASSSDSPTHGPASVTRAFVEARHVA